MRKRPWGPEWFLLDRFAFARQTLGAWVRSFGKEEAAEMCHEMVQDELLSIEARAAFGAAFGL